MTRPEPFRRAGFACFRILQTRWADNDIYGHMNNVVHYALFDTAINGWLVDAGLLTLAGGDRSDAAGGKVYDPDSDPVGLVVETGCRYFAEMAFPDLVTAGIRVTRIGNSSVAYEVALFRGEDDQASAQGHFVHVYVGRQSRRPQNLPAAWRARLQEISL